LIWAKKIMSIIRLRNARLLFAVALCLALAALAGCGKGRATVNGKVTLNGKPLTTGTVSFIGGPSDTGSGHINADGTYAVPDAPLGDCKVTVQTPRAMGGVQGMPKPPAGMKGMPKEMLPPGAEEGSKAVRVVPAPEKYGSPDTTPVTYTVKKGTQTFDIDLKP
jgi:hypothetical protein